MITLAVAWYARSRNRFDEEIFMFTGLMDVVMLGIISSTISSILNK
jgi:hypothetical protein